MSCLGLPGWLVIGTEPVGGAVSRVWSMGRVDRAPQLLLPITEAVEEMVETEKATEGQ